MARTRSIEARDRDTKALELRRINLTYAQIAERMGWRSASAAHDAVQRALADSVAEPSAEVRQLELERLDDMARHLYRILGRAHYVVTQAGRLVYPDPDSPPLQDPGPVLQAVAGLLRISESRRKLLGLDAPARARIEVITEDMVETAIRELEEELGRRAAEAGSPGAG